jgi:valyl-tRNA synthetase
MRQDLDIPPDKEIRLIISSAARETRELALALSPQIKKLANLKHLDIEQKYTHRKSSVSAIVKDLHITIPLGGIIDIEKEKTKLEAKIDKIETEIKAKEKTLANKDFIRKAPQEIVEKEKLKLLDLKEIAKKIKGVKNELE